MTGSSPSAPGGVPRRRHRATRVVAAFAAVAALATLTTACSKSADPAPGSGGSGVAAGGNDPLPGVTADSIKIGYVIVDLGTLEASLGFKSADYGGVQGQTNQINAIVNAVNANGGLNGRKIIPVIKTYVAQQDSPESAEALCNSFTQDDQVFAVVMDGQFQSNARPCYYARKTLMIDVTQLAQDQTEFQKFAPYLWSPTYPEYSSYLKTLLASLQTSGWFNGQTGVAIVGVSNDVARRDIQQVVLPFLTQNGITKTQSFFVDTSNAGTLGAGSSAALTGAANAGLNRIITVGGARILPVMLSTLEATTTKATYSISSYDSPLFLQDNPKTVAAQTLQGMLGFGFLPPGDLRDDPTVPFPDPSNPSQILCTQIVNAAGATPPPGGRPNWRDALQYCDATLFLKAAVDRAPKDLTASAFQSAAWTIGTAYSSSATFGGNFASGQYASTSSGRVLGYDPTTCLNPTTKAPGCFLYRGGNVPFAAN